jgi:AraC-like DNA-binding protein
MSKMEFRTKYITPDIKLSCFEDKFFKTEIAFEHHMLVWFISGETKIVMADAEYIFGAGDIFLIPRNQLATIILYPKDDLPNKSVTMLLSAGRLKEIYSGLDIKTDNSSVPGIRSYNSHPLLASCLQSLIPYFDMQEDFPENIASLKITEAINILREIDKEIDSVLANFEEIGKIALAEFMEKNFMFNMPLEKFSYLTGRSLTTFKRDFKKAFNTTPQKWLTKKRLESAHYQLAEKKRKPGEVYYETGFENLSHFSYAFKKQYGYSPTQLLSKA